MWHANHPQKQRGRTDLGSTRSCTLRRFGRRKVGIAALVVWLLGGLLLPLVHQLDHHHNHSHGVSHRRVYSETLGTHFIRVGSHTASTVPHHHHHTGLLTKAWHWFQHLWSHSHTHHPVAQHTQQNPKSVSTLITSKSKSGRTRRISEHLALKEHLDPFHGEDSLAHFDLLDKTSIVLWFGLPHQPSSTTPIQSSKDQFFQHCISSEFQPRAPPIV